MKTISSNGGTLELNWTTGIVDESGKNMETKVSGGGGGGFSYRGTGTTAPVSIRSKTTVHDQIFLTDTTGREHSFQLQNFNLACRAGNKLTVLWGIKKGAKSGPYIIVYNHSTAKEFINNADLNKMFRRPIWQLFIAIAICFFIALQNPVFFIFLAAVVVYWIIEGNVAASKFRKNINYNDFS